VPLSLCNLFNLSSCPLSASLFLTFFYRCLPVLFLPFSACPLFYLSILFSLYLSRYNLFLPLSTCPVSAFFSYHLPTFLFLSYLCSSFPVLSMPFFSCPISAFLFLSYFCLSFPVLSLPFFSCPISLPFFSCPISAFLFLSYLSTFLFLSYLCLTFPVLSLPFSSRPLSTFLRKATHLFLEGAPPLIHNSELSSAPCWTCAALLLCACVCACTFYSDKFINVCKHHITQRYSTPSV
jgi:hypothetical protein